MMKRIARAVRYGGPNDAIAMLKETSLASGMMMDSIGEHVMLLGVSKLIAVRLRLNDVMFYRDVNGSTSAGPNSARTRIYKPEPEN